MNRTGVVPAAVVACLLLPIGASGQFDRIPDEDPDERRDPISEIYVAATINSVHPAREGELLEEVAGFRGFSAELGIGLGRNFYLSALTTWTRADDRLAEGSYEETGYGARFGYRHPLGSIRPFAGPVITFTRFDRPFERAAFWGSSLGLEVGADWGLTRWAGLTGRASYNWNATNKPTERVIGGLTNLHARRVQLHVGVVLRHGFGG